ncbi:MAG: hypothetical protein LUC88_04490 [Prevotella sp.]|nr:hypothetical protein [Prevotella sp.]
MRYIRDYPDLQLVESLRDKKGFSVPEFNHLVYGDKSGNTIKGRLRDNPNVSSKVLVRICNLLDVSLDDLFQKCDEVLKPTQVSGDNNIVNSNNIHIDMLQLRAENKVLKMLVNEKEERIKELKKVNDDIGKRLDFLLNNAINRDKKE